MVKPFADKSGGLPFFVCCCFCHGLLTRSSFHSMDRYGHLRSFWFAGVIVWGSWRVDAWCRCRCFSFVRSVRAWQKVTGTHFQRRVVEVASKDVRCGLIASCRGIWESTSCVCVCVFRKSSIDSVLECSCAKMSFVQEAVEQLHAVRFSSLQSASDCGTDRSS